MLKHASKRVLLLVLIMAVVSFAVTALTILMLYRAAFREETARLVELAHSQARLIEAVARFDAVHSKADHKEGPMAATLSQIVNAHEQYEGVGETGEFTLAKRQGDQIIFLLNHRHKDLDHPLPVPFDSKLAEPMRLALSGKSGTVVGLDYRGEKVLAAFEPLAELHLGIVAKIDLTEIRAPFLKAGMLSLLIAFLLVLAGAILFMRITDPVITRLMDAEEGLKRHRNHLEELVKERTVQLEKMNRQSQLDIEQRKSVEKELKESNRMLRALDRAQSLFILDSDPRILFDGLLTSLLSLTTSEYGFIAEVLHTPEAVPYLKTHAVTNIAWDKTTREFYEKNALEGMEFRNLSTLFGAVVTTGEAVIANSPATDPRSGGLPEGHPPLNAFLGLPIYRGETFLGAIGVANRPEGYHDSLIKYLEPFLASCGNILEGYRNDLRRRKAEKEIEQNYRTQHVLNSVLKLSLGALSPEEILRRTLELILSLPDFKLENKGSIGLVDESGDFLVMRSQIGLPGTAQKTCARIPLGKCLCGKAALTGEILFSDHVDERHEIRYDGMMPHGHYCVPIKTQDKVLGVLDVYLKEGHRRDSGEEEFLKALCDALAGIITRVRAKKALREAHDQLEQKVVERTRDLNVARESAETANRTKSQFLANMSHEIRTPLNAVLGFLELVLEESSLTELQRKHLTTAYMSANGLLGLINDILDISKLERGKLTIELRPFDLLQLMREIYETMNIKALEKGLELELDIQPSLSEAFVGDPLRLRQIIINLASNAIKFTGKGHVSIQVEPAKEEGHLYFKIEDTGIGIPAERLSQIFESFIQADTSTTRRFGGTGLGTTIARELVELMGGRIWAESVEGKGSTFHFTIDIPSTDQVPEEAELFSVPGKAVFPGSRRGFRILLVEDIEANMVLTKIRLKQQGHEVTVAWNGREAVEAFIPGEFDIILMDIQMPEMGGLEATERIRALEADTGRHVPIIAMTAAVMMEETEEYLKVGMDAVLAKPIDFGKLFKIMERIIPEGVGELVAEVEKDTSALSGLELPPLNGVDIKEGIQTWQNPEAYSKALQLFSRDYGNIADKLSRIIDEGDVDSAHRIAHALKGVAGNLSVSEVADVAINIDAALREKRIDNVKDQLPTLAAALNTAVYSIRQLEVAQDVERMPKKEMDMQYLTELFIKMLAAFDQFSPNAIEPFLSELEGYFSQEQLSPIVDHMKRFDFDEAKKETVKLAKNLNIDLEG
jgi:signal transduction histidine kinase/HPt (histidine-containing phosphotransfer) domain-containing protein/AmiR/NasT family two-component response regulator